MRSSYATQTFNLCAITDLDEGGHKSVTNDIEAVLADLVEAGVLVPGHPYQRVIYRDSDRHWDRVVIDDACRYVGFAPVVPSSEERVPQSEDPRALLAMLLRYEAGKQ